MRKNMIKEEANYLLGVMRDALYAAFQVHEKLGEKGCERMSNGLNQFGDSPLVLDWEAEEAVLKSLRLSGIPIRVFSEEHGMVEIGEPPYGYTGFLDGIDGSYVCLHEYGVGRYATMFAIFRGEDPTYGDALVSGIMEHATERMFLAIKGGGAFIEKNEERMPLGVSSCTELNAETRIYTDVYTPLEQKVYEKKWARKPWRVTMDTHCASIDYTDLLLGDADVVTEALGKKQDIEKLVAYLLVIEAGGVMIDWLGESLENKRCLAPGTEESIMIAASSMALAQELRAYIIL